MKLGNSIKEEEKNLLVPTKSKDLEPILFILLINGDRIEMDRFYN